MDCGQTVKSSGSIEFACFNAVSTVHHLLSGEGDGGLILLFEMLKERFRSSMISSCSSGKMSYFSSLWWKRYVCFIFRRMNFFCHLHLLWVGYILEEIQLSEGLIGSLKFYQVY